LRPFYTVPVKLIVNCPFVPPTPVIPIVNHSSLAEVALVKLVALVPVALAVSPPFNNTELPVPMVFLLSILNETALNPALPTKAFIAVHV
jgi:hypothetical protein